MSRRLLLDPQPQSVRHARRWVVEALEGLGRSDLVDSAELGVSELVTNAILHADPPITVRVRGTAQHPRVEVHDTSTRPPAVNTEMAEDEFLLSTVGRGLGLLALYSATWGADVSPDGKMVWFEPADEPDFEQQHEGSVFDLSEVVSADLPPAPPPEQMVPLRLLGMPVQLWAGFRHWYAEIGRELRLLALAHPEDYPVARELFEVTLRVERERLHARGIEVLDAAIADGADRADLDYLVHPDAPATMRRLAEVLNRVDEFCRHDALLTVPATARQKELRNWYFGEFARQPAGEPPRPWPGSYDADTEVQ